MNVTIKIEDALCHEASHRAVDRGLPLSAWIAQVLQKEPTVEKRVTESPLEALAMEVGEEQVFEIPRDPFEGHKVNSY
jgi:hypothetical protein